MKNEAQSLRYQRLAQQKCRGSKRSIATEVEDLKICLAWEAGNLTEGQVVRALGYDRVSCRILAQEAIEAGGKLARLLINKPQP